MGASSRDYKVYRNDLFCQSVRSSSFAVSAGDDEMPSFSSLTDPVSGVCAATGRRGSIGMWARFEFSRWRR
jgi:hypothetical protein